MATLKVRGKTLTNDISFNRDNVSTQNVTTNNTMTSSLFVSGQTVLNGPVSVNDSITINDSLTKNDSISSTYTSGTNSISVSLNQHGFEVNENNFPGDTFGGCMTIIGTSNNATGMQLRQNN